MIGRLSAVERIISGRRVAGAILHVGVVAALTIGIKFSVIYFVDSQRSTTHWMIYESVEPAKNRYKIGQKPVFRTRATRFHNVTMAWNDILYCADSEGELKDQYKFIGTAPLGNKVKVGPAYLGYDNMLPGMNSDYKWLSGYWNWEGPLPTVPSTCFLLPQPVVYASISVEPKVVVVPPSQKFIFY